METAKCYSDTDYAFSNPLPSPRIGVLLDEGPETSAAHSFVHVDHPSEFSAQHWEYPMVCERGRPISCDSEHSSTGRNVRPMDQQANPPPIQAVELRTHLMTAVSHWISPLDADHTMLEVPLQNAGAVIQRAAIHEHDEPHGSGKYPEKSRSQGRRTERVPTRLIQVPSNFIYEPPGDGHCPIPSCSFILPDGPRQWRSDLQRHIDSHFAKARADWRCCGVPVEDAYNHGLLITNASALVVWPEVGIYTVGGCGQVFSRKDAYRRHLKQSKTCIGDSNGVWVPGNVRRARQ